MSVKSCPHCQKNVCVDSRCFDCKRPIQWICFKCQWESNICDHTSCHQNVLIPEAMPNQKPVIRHYDHLIVDKGQEAYWWAVRQTAQALA